VELLINCILLLGEWSIEEAQDVAIRGDLGLVLKVNFTINMTTN